MSLKMLHVVLKIHGHYWLNKSHYVGRVGTSIPNPLRKSQAF